MFVKNRMSKDVICINENESISKALDLMSLNDLHRLPVINDNKLVGLITRSIIASNTPSNATSLSVFELNYLISKTSVKDIMIKDVITCSAEDLLEDVAVKMRKENVGCLPVVENDRVIGIITHNDIFDAFIDLLGYYQNGYRFVIEVKEDKEGVLKEIASSFLQNNAFITNLAVYHIDNETEVVVIASGVSESVIVEDLESKGFKVSSSVNNHSEGFS